MLSLKNNHFIRRIRTIQIDRTHRSIRKDGYCRPGKLTGMSQPFFSARKTCMFLFFFTDFQRIEEHRPLIENYKTLYVFTIKTVFLSCSNDKFNIGLNSNTFIAQNTIVQYVKKSSVNNTKTFVCWPTVMISVNDTVMVGTNSR